MGDKSSGRRFPFRMLVKGGSDLLFREACPEGEMAFIGVLHGRVALRIGLHQLVASEGALYFVPPSALLLAEAEGGFASVRVMTFHRSILSENMNSLEQDLLYMLAIQARVTPLAIEREHPLYERLSAYLQSAEEEYLAKEPCSQLIVRASIYQMMTELLRYYSGEKRDGERAVYHNVLRLKTVLDRIELDREGNATIAELSGMLLVSPDHFTRIFRDSLGITPLEYMNRVRVERALSLLAGGESVMDKIAREAGFSTRSYFYRLFRAMVGLSPLAFKKRYF